MSHCEHYHTQKFGLTQIRNMIRYSLIIPTLKVSESLRQQAFNLTRNHPGVEVIVVEACSQKRIMYTREGNVCFVTSLKGRGSQLNAGAKFAHAETLIFLHSDTSLPEDAFETIERIFSDLKVQVACFRLRFNDPHWLLRVYGFFTRFDSVWTSFGDQGIVARKTFFEELKGFSDWPLFEDVDFLQRARKKRRILKLPSTVVTDAVRYRKNGVVGQQVKNAWLLIKYLRGASPWELANQYQEKEGEE